MAHANFQVATKALVIKDNTVLTLTTPKGYVDFPGGRLDDTEYTIPLKEGLQRELKEELGNSIKYTINDLAFASKRDYFYHRQHHVVALFYEVIYESGKFILSDEHVKLEWLSPKELISRKDNFQGGNEYDELYAYLVKKNML
jgi:8-oxo-dGTP pyrophosphatase MutT (NUDIX family)